MLRVIASKVLPWVQLCRLDKPIGIYLLLWPALVGLWCAQQGVPSLSVMLVFVFGVVIMRSAGCVVNDILDYNIDCHVERTKYRPITSGKISRKKALCFLVFLFFLAFLLVLQTNALTILLSFLALALTVLYPLMKRFIQSPQLVLGMAFSMAVPMSYTAQNVNFDLSTLCLMFSVVVWTIMYDTMYAMVDREDDLKIGVKSTAIFFGKYDVIACVVMQVICIVLWLILGGLKQFGAGYYIGVLVCGVLFFYQYKLIENRQRTLCFKAFLHNHYVGLVWFLSVVTGTM